MTDARARVEAWMEEVCREHSHQHYSPGVQFYRYRCPDCLLAFAAARRDEEREACAVAVEADGTEWHAMSDGPIKGIDVSAAHYAKIIRARRAGQP